MTHDRLEERYARAEEKTVRGTAATVRRGPVSLIAVCLGVALVVGITAAVDLRRLGTPRGTAQAWTGAAVFGDCTAYRELAVLEAADEDARCRALRERTDRARDRPDDVAIDVVSVRQDGDRAQVVVRVDLPGRAARDVTLPLRRSGGDWAVVPDDDVCAVLACP